MFWSENFLLNRRKQWLAAIAKFEYLVEETWHEAVINAKNVVDNNVVITISLPRLSEAQTITAVRVIDTSGNEAGRKTTSISRDANQGTLLKFEFAIYEKEGNN
jgi:hypothetical protein